MDPYGVADFRMSYEFDLPVNGGEMHPAIPMAKLHAPIPKLNRSKKVVWFNYDVIIRTWSCVPELEIKIMILILFPRVFVYTLRACVLWR